MKDRFAGSVEHRLVAKACSFKMPK